MYTGVQGKQGAGISPNFGFPRVYGGSRQNSTRVATRAWVSPCIRGFKVGQVRFNDLPSGFPVYTGVQGSRTGTGDRPWRFPRVYGGSRIDLRRAFDRQPVSPCIRGFQDQKDSTLRPRIGFPVYTGVQARRRSFPA